MPCKQSRSVDPDEPYMPLQRQNRCMTLAILFILGKHMHDLAILFIFGKQIISKKNKTKGELEGKNRP